jgi:AraC family transcriptional regulator
MKTPTSLPAELSYRPILSSREQGWENIVVEQFHPPPDECTLHYTDEHSICLSLSPQPVRFTQILDGKSYTSLYGKGDISIAPAKTPFFARWESEDNYLLIRITARFIQQVAREALDKHPDQIEFRPKRRMRDPQMESIALMLLAELKQNNFGGKLYVDSLTNVFVLHLLRQYTATKLSPPAYESGLPQYQLLQVLEYIQEYLDQDINLADLAALLDMSPFHFSYLFKKAIGTSPYQYFLQPRVDRAKQLLTQTEKSVMEIALDCGFNSHSHLSKQFRQSTGMTPTAYRAG